MRWKSAPGKYWNHQWCNQENIQFGNASFLYAEARNERSIADLLLRAISTGTPINDEALYEHALPLHAYVTLTREKANSPGEREEHSTNQKTASYLNKLAYHIGVKECARYAHPPANTNEIYLPLAVAQFRALKLVQKAQ